MLPAIELSRLGKRLHTTNTIESGTRGEQEDGEDRNSKYERCCCGQAVDDNHAGVSTHNYRAGEYMFPCPIASALILVRTSSPLSSLRRDHLPTAQQLPRSTTGGLSC